MQVRALVPFYRTVMGRRRSGGMEVSVFSCAPPPTHRSQSLPSPLAKAFSFSPK